MMTIDQIIRECRTVYSIRFVADRWRIYRNATPILEFQIGAEALKALRELQGAEIVR